MDDGWSKKSRDSSGNLAANDDYFPDGIAAVANQIHGLGLKFGLYGDSGTKTCPGHPGSRKHEKQDTALLAPWEVDYWKYDNCHLKIWEWDWLPFTNSSHRYGDMRDGLADQHQTHKILYSLCQWGKNNVWTWSANFGNSWRISRDLKNSWSSVASFAAKRVPVASYAQCGGFNDLDMLQIGNGVLTAAEERSHFGLWAIAKSPLLLGTDLSKISNSSLAIIQNAGIIAINQDPLGRAATIFQPKGAGRPDQGSLHPYCSGQLDDGYVIGLVAVNDGLNILSVSFADVPGLGLGDFNWKELYTGQCGRGRMVNFTLQSHDMAVLKVTL